MNHLGNQKHDITLLFSLLLGLPLSINVNGSYHDNSKSEDAIKQLLIHLLAPQTLSTILKAHISNVMENSLFAWMSAASARVRKPFTIEETKPFS